MRWTILILGLLACRALPPPPLPVLEPNTNAIGGVGDAVVYAPTKVVLATSGGPRTLRTQWEGLDSYTGDALFDLHLSAAKALTERWLVSGHASVSTLGLDTRVLLGDPRGAIVGSLSAGGLGDALYAKVRAGDVHGSGDLHLRLGGGAQLGLGAGLSWGTRRRIVRLPDDPAIAEYGVDQQVPSWLTLVRRETRLEASVALTVRVSSIALMLAVQPFVVVGPAHAGTVFCGQCAPGVSLESYESRWGAAVSLTLLAL